MSDDVIAPGTGGAPTHETRKVVGGWKAMQQKKANGEPAETRQQRLLREQDEKAQRVREGKPAEKEETGYKPGDEAGSGEFNVRRAKEFMTEKLKVNQSQKTFKGNAQLCMAKLAMLSTGDEDTQAAKNFKLVKIEDAGFGVYKFTYTSD